MTVQTNTHWKWLHIVSTGAAGNSLGTPILASETKDFIRKLGATVGPEYDPQVRYLQIGSANSQLHQRFTVDTEGTRERARYHWKALDARFSDHLSDHQIDVCEKRSTETKSFSLEICQGVGAVCVYDQPGDEATLVKQMESDRTLPEYHIDLISESSGVSLLELSRSIRRFLSFFQNPWQRDSETSGLAMLLGRACGAETFVPWTLLERAGVQRQTVLAVGPEYDPQVRGSETSEHAMLLVRACGAETFVPRTLLERAGASCVFMLELNFHSGSSIYSSETDEHE
ncbi:hypothetical protein F2Q69_00027049 [Brassica cretica]|uniref:Uncharacterized protein n=1 Tax=Brassica cretica TaxID=69181 RepID=A0A8S9RR27_BRACR|nr:hypothetical protein F2Q69_00027049 [Brassica cretica]